MKRVYQVVAVYKNGKQVPIGSPSMMNIESARIVRENHIRYNENLIDQIKNSQVTAEIAGSRSGGNIISYEIRSREVTPWELEEELEV